MTYRNAARTLYALLAVIVVGFFVFLYWEYQPSQVFKVTAPITVEPPIVSPGAIAILTVNYCKMQDVQGTIRTSFVSSSTETFQPMSQELGKKGCMNNVKLPIIIPKDLVPDTYYIKFRITYQLNPLRSVVEDFKTETFVIQ